VLILIYGLVMTILNAQSAARTLRTYYVTFLWKQSVMGVARNLKSVLNTLSPK